MADSVTIPFWPQSPECIDWSIDNRIVVVGGENIAIVTPLLHGRGQDGRLWDATIIKINGFTSDELPLEDPLPAANFSIGEEQSARQALLAKWSPTGLAQHKGCALAVLTSNHVLSIWAHEGKETLRRSWKRALIINHTIRHFYEEQNKQTAGEDDHDRPRVQQRIKSFAWSSSVLSGQTTPGDVRYTGVDQLLVVATEGGDLFYLSIQSPHSEDSPQHHSWEATIVSRVRLSDCLNRAVNSENGIPLASTQSAAAASTTKAEHLRWGPWKEEKGLLCSHVTFIANEIMIVCRVHSQRFREAGHRKSLGARGPHLDALPENHAPRFIRSDGDKVMVLSSSFLPNPAGTIFRFQTRNASTLAPLTPPGSATTTTFKGDENWDTVTGTAFTVGGTDIRVHTTRELSSLAYHWAAYDVQSLKQHSDENWTAALSQCKASYAAEFGLEVAHVQQRVLGIAASPLCEYLATCATLHPSNAIAYIISSEQNCIMNITYGVSGSSPDRWLPLNMQSQRISMEALLFSLRRTIERKGASSSTSSTNDLENITGELLNHMPRCSPLPASFEPEHLDHVTGDQARMLIWYLRSQIFDINELRKERASCIAKVALAGQEHNPSLNNLTIQRVLSEVLKIPQHKYDLDRTSSHLRKNYEIILAKLAWMGSDPATMTSDETCNMCSKPIPFEALKWARCEAGHDYPRCALTFLALQSPGCAKRCRICGLDFLNGDVHKELEAGPKKDVVMTNGDGERNARPNDAAASMQIEQTGANGDTSKATLAQLLFAACDVCVYCGGMYTT